MNNEYQHNPQDHNTSFLDFWDEGLDSTTASTYVYFLADQDYRSTETPLTDYEIYNPDKRRLRVNPFMTMYNEPFVTSNNLLMYSRA
jgi:hypothetical protein